MKLGLTALTVAAMAATTAIVPAAVAGPVYQQVAQANPCAAKKNPCAGKANPCAAKANPCAAKGKTAANPCAAKNPCAAGKK